MSSLHVLSIHDIKDFQLAVDLKDILCAVAEYLPSWHWCITSLDSQGGNSEGICRKVEEARPTGLWISSDDLLRFAAAAQVIDGTLFAFPKAIHPDGVSKAELSISDFPSGRAELAIVAVDGTWFDVFTRNADIAEILRRRFQDVRDEDTRAFFEKPAAERS